MKQLHQPYKT